MRRRDLLSTLSGASALAVAGCLGFRTRSAYAPLPVVADRPDAVYLPTHVEGTKLAGVATAGPLACALTYTYPHRFWTVTGTHTRRVDIREDDSVHLMATVWDVASGAVLPEMEPRLTVRRGGEAVATRSPWPMLSQPMGYHFGDNVSLPAEDDYEVRVAVAPSDLPRTGFDAAFEDATFAFDYAYSRDDLAAIDFRQLDDVGAPGAVPAMTMDRVPLARAPAPDALPGRRFSPARSGDVVFAATVRSADRFPETHHLAVSPRTRYRGYVLPYASLSARLTRDGETLAATPLHPAVDATLGYHYAAGLDAAVRAGDALVVSVDAPPQVARHEGYETAFFDVGPATLTA